jgi:hypothetical protein
MNWSLTPLWILDVDPKFVPLSVPVWLKKQGEKLLNRLLVFMPIQHAYPVLLEQAR